VFIVDLTEFCPLAIPWQMAPLHRGLSKSAGRLNSHRQLQQQQQQQQQQHQQQHHLATPPALRHRSGSSAEDAAAAAAAAASAGAKKRRADRRRFTVPAVLSFTGGPFVVFFSIVLSSVELVQKILKPISRCIHFSFNSFKSSVCAIQRLRRLLELMIVKKKSCT